MSHHPIRQKTLLIIDFARLLTIYLTANVIIIWRRRSPTENLPLNPERGKAANDVKPMPMCHICFYPNPIFFYAIAIFLQSKCYIFASHLEPM